MLQWSAILLITFYASFSDWMLIYFFLVFRFISLNYIWLKTITRIREFGSLFIHCIKWCGVLVQVLIPIFSCRKFSSIIVLFITYLISIFFLVIAISGSISNLFMSNIFTFTIHNISAFWKFSSNNILLFITVSLVDLIPSIYLFPWVFWSHPVYFWISAF